MPITKEDELKERARKKTEAKLDSAGSVARLGAESRLRDADSPKAKKRAKRRIAAIKAVFGQTK